MKILFTGGGTGGHILPIIALSRETERIYKGEKPLTFSYIGPKDNFAKILLSQEGISVKTIVAGKIRRYFHWKSLLLNFLDVFLKIPLGFLQSFFYIFFLAPDIVFSKGGYGSLAPVLCGWLMGVPVLLHESDAVPGLANRVSGRFASKIFIAFPKSHYFPAHKTQVVGNPFRRKVLEGSLEEAKGLFNLTGEKPIILISGGSQGAQKINETVLNILPDLLSSFEIIHQTGQKNYIEVKNQASVMVDKIMEKYYHPFPFLKEIEIKHAYAAAGLIVSRAGSGSIFEIAALGKPSILVPLPIAAQNHQVQNAYAYAKVGAALVVEEANLTPHFFLEKLKYLFSHPEELEAMSKKAKEFSKPEAARHIAEYLLSYLK